MAITLPKPLYPQLAPRWCGLDREGVANDQRLRLIGAMVAVADGEGGYASANITLLSALAGVSRQAFYDRFGTVEACFLATYEHVVARASRRVGAAYRGEEDREAGLRAAFAAYAREVVNEPKAARLALIETLALGPVAVAPMRRTRVSLERALGTCFSEAPGGVGLSPLLIKGIVRGVESVTRRRLLNDGVGELPALSDELLRWALSYRSAAAAGLAPGPAAGPFERGEGIGLYRPWAGAASDRVRILRSAARIAAVKGYAQLTPAQIVREAGVGEATFEALFESTEQCLLDALDRLGLEALVCAAAASRESEDRQSGVYRGIAALMGHIAANPGAARVACVEILAVGAAGIERRERLLDRFTDLLARGLPRAGGASNLAAEASVGAIWGLVEDHVARGATRMLPGLAGYAGYLALAPAIGAERAIEVIREAESTRLTARTCDTR